MSLLTEPVIQQSRQRDVARTEKEWLDALASDTCDQAAFIAGVSEMLRKSPEAGWELLALVDQYYRRGKINADTFNSLKTCLQGLLVGTGGGAPTRIPHSMPSAPPAVSTPEAIVPIATAEEPVLPPRDLSTGDLLRERYRVQGVLGRGGMGTVFAAVDEYRLDRTHGEQRVALKVLHTEVMKRPRLLAELRREFQHLQSLSHPNIVRVHEFDRDGDLAFFTMELLSGTLLSRLVTGQTATPLYRPYALAILRDVGAAVIHAHMRGVVHGDLNPANIFITDNGEVRVLDFGASHQLHRGPWISDFESPQPTVATPLYASCQILEGEAADARDDTYALACIAYVLLSGRLPFGNETALKARTRGITPGRPRGIGPREWKALREGLRFDRERRPSDVAAWLGRLDLRRAVAHLPELPLLTNRRHKSHAIIKWAMIGSAAAGCAAGLWLAAGHVEDMTRLLRNLAVGSQRPGRDTPLVIDLPHEDSSSMPVAAATVPQETPPMAPPLETAASVPRAPISSSRPTVVAPQAAQSGLAVRSRIELAADNVDVAPADAEARVGVHRTRTWREASSFTWWTESGTAKPGRDFVAVMPQLEHFDSGKQSVTLIVPLVMDPARRTERSFYVVIDEASDNATLGPRTLTQVTLPARE